MRKFKVGDVVRFVGADENTYDEEIKSNGKFGRGWVDDPNEESFWNHRKFIEVIRNTNNKTIMTNLVTKFSNLFVKEPQLSFRKSGITDNQDILTDEGQKVFLSWLLTQNADKFKKEVVDELLKTEDK